MKRNIILAITLLAFFLFGATLVRALFWAPESELPVPAAQDAPIHAVGEGDQPARLRIPQLEVNAKIQYVGVAASGNMAVPTNFRDVGWYRYGTVPGQVGSAVIDGHVDNALGLPGVFKDLHRLRKGDRIYVQTKSGDELEFVVQDVKTYGYKDVPADLLFGRTDAPRLNLITCGGSWVQAERTYDERVVVYTVRAP